MKKPYVPPQSMNEFVERSYENMQVSGFKADVRQSLACPFCAAPNFLSYRVLEARATLEVGGVCCECGRGARAVFVDDVSGVSFEIVQTVGEDPPDWLNPKPRRDIGGGH